MIGSTTKKMPDNGRSISRNVAKSNMIQDMINSDNMNSTESTIPNIFKPINVKNLVSAEDIL